MQHCVCTDLCHVSLIVEGCVFHYERSEAIKQRQIISDVLFDVLTTGMHEGSEWTVKVITNKEMPQRSHTQKRRRLTS